MGGGGVNISLVGKINPVFEGIWFSGTAEDITGFTIQLEGKTVEIPVVNGKFEYKNEAKLSSLATMFCDGDSLAGLYQNTNKITSLDFSKTRILDISINMYQAFYGCSNLKTLNLSNIKYNKECHWGNTSYMFYYCNKLEWIRFEDDRLAEQFLECGIGEGLDSNGYVEYGDIVFPKH